MRRFWFEFDPATLAQLEERYVPIHRTEAGASNEGAGVGVTGHDELDCLRMIRARIFAGRPLPRVNRVIADVDVSSLGEHVLGNMEPPIWRGVWFPLGYADPPTT